MQQDDGIQGSHISREDDFKDLMHEQGSPHPLARSQILSSQYAIKVELGAYGNETEAGVVIPQRSSKVNVVSS